MTPPRVLISKTSHGRVGAELQGIEPVIMDESGALSVMGTAVTPEDAGLDAAWINFDVFGSPAAKPFMAAILKAPNIRWVQSAAAGLDHPVFADIARKGVTMATTHVQSVGIAEYVLWAVMDVLQRGPERHQAQADKKWERFRAREMAKTKWLVVGFGAIGQDIAQRARGFGAKITGVRRKAGAHPLADEMIPDWRAGLAESDVVVLSLPLTPETKRMADAAAFAAMKPGAILVNIARGGLVDEPALLAALDQGRPGHAVFDVFDTEPLPADSPFWAHPKVTVSAHASSASEGYARRADEWFLENLRRFVAGEPLLHVVDPAGVIAGVTLPRDA